MDRDKLRQTDRQIAGQRRDRQTQRYRRAGGREDRQTGRQTDGKTGSQTSRQTAGRQADKNR